MPDRLSIDASFRRAANAINYADAFIITAGAGMGVLLKVDNQCQSAGRDVVTKMVTKEIAVSNSVVTKTVSKENESERMNAVVVRVEVAK